MTAARRRHSILTAVVLAVLAVLDISGDSGSVPGRGGDTADAGTAAHQAIGLFARKGDHVPTAVGRDR